MDVVTLSLALSNTVDLTCIAGAGGIQQYQVVYLSSTGTVSVANVLTPSHAGKVIGVALTPGHEGTNIKVRKAGIIKNPTWGLVSGIQYVGLGGGLTHQLLDSFQWVQKVGIAVDSSTLMIDITSVQPDGDYEHLRARATTKDDVGLSYVKNVDHTPVLNKNSPTDPFNGTIFFRIIEEE